MGRNVPGENWDKSFVSVFFRSRSIHTATSSLEDYEQAYIVHTGFAG